MSAGRARAALAAAVAVVAAACGIPDDDAPRVIAEDALPAELTDRPDVTAPIPPGEGETRIVYMVTAEGADQAPRLVAVQRTIRRTDDLEQKITATLNSLIDRGEDREFGTRLPESLEVSGVHLNTTDRVLQIDLNGDMASVEGRAQALAYAQLVFTATEFDGVDAVRFTKDGETANALKPDGESASLVTRSSYAEFAPPPG